MRHCSPTLVLAASVLATSLAAQATAERMRDLPADQAAGKVRWLQAKLVAGELECRDATRQIVEAFEHEWFLTRVVVIECAAELDLEIVREAVARELPRMAKDLQAFAGEIRVPDGAADKQTVVRGGMHYWTSLCALASIVAGERVEGALTETTSALVDALAAGSDPAAVAVPSALGALVRIGSEGAMQGAVSSYEALERLLDRKPVKSAPSGTLLSDHKRVAAYVADCANLLAAGFEAIGVKAPRAAVGRKVAAAFKNLLKTRRKPAPDRDAKKDSDPAATARVRGTGTVAEFQTRLEAACKALGGRVPRTPR